MAGRGIGIGIGIGARFTSVGHPAGGFVPQFGDCGQPAGGLAPSLVCPGLSAGCPGSDEGWSGLPGHGSGRSDGDLGCGQFTGPVGHG